VLEVVARGVRTARAVANQCTMNEKGTRDEVSAAHAAGRHVEDQDHQPIDLEADAGQHSVGYALRSATTLAAER